MKCIKCNKEYEINENYAIFDNYNLNLCKTCFEYHDELYWDEDDKDRAPEDKKIQRQGNIDIVTHKITCPKCKSVYDSKILHKQCNTKGCNVWFFWDDLDSVVFARWIDL